MDELRKLLESFPDLVTESGQDGLRIRAADESGADVAIARDPRAGLYIVSMADWHESFIDRDEAEGRFLLALSPLARVACTDVGSRCVEAEFQVTDALGQWQPVSLHIRRRSFDFTFGPRRVRYLSNSHIGADMPILTSAAQTLTATPTAASPVVIEAEQAPLDRPFVRLKLGAITGAIVGAALVAVLLPQHTAIAAAAGGALGIAVAFALPAASPWSQIRFTGETIELLRSRGGPVTIPATEVAMVGGEVAVEMNSKQLFAPRVVRLLHAGRSYAVRLRPMDAAACFTLACRVCASAVRINFDGWSQPPVEGRGAASPEEILASERARRWRRDLRFTVACSLASLVSLLTAIAAAAAGRKGMMLAVVSCAVFASLAATSLARGTAQRRRLALAESMDRAPAQRLAA